MITVNSLRIFIACIICIVTVKLYAQHDTDSIFLGHKVMLDENKKLLPCTVPATNPYDYLLRLRWNFVETKAPQSPGPLPGSSYPQYYFYCAWIDSAGLMLPDSWMNDVGERVPNWFESARLYYAYTGDMQPMTIAKGLIDYSLQHGITPSNFSWPNFPYTTTNAGDLEFRGFTSAKRFSLHDVQVDHAGDMAATYYRMFLFYKDIKYKTAAIKIADVLAKKASAGDAANSPWPYVVNMKTGKTVSEYGSNWFNCIKLFNLLIADNAGNVNAYKAALKKVQDWILHYPVKNGLWVDGHSDTYITGTSNLSNMSASNAGLYISDYPEFDPEWKNTLPGLIKWTEDNFITKSAPGEPSTFFGANIVSEQVSFMPKMDYQTARYAAQCARWYAVSGDDSYKEKAFRSLNFVTYCNDSTGKVFESPFSKGVNSWWSDCYGESPRMIYHVFAAIPEWAPAKEDHLLYSEGIIKNVSYSKKKVQYTAVQKEGTEFLRLSFVPSVITINGVKISENTPANKDGYTFRDLGNGDYAVTIKRIKTGKVIIAGL